jgi:hypothetical protein
MVVVGFCGSGALPSSAQPLVAACVQGWLAAGAQVAVGCAAGADAAVVSAVLSAGAASRLTVFCAFAPSGQGAAGLVSSVAGVSAALFAGAVVRWLAGGSLAVPVRGRLAQRSLAFVRFLAAQQSAAPGGGLVGFVSSLPSSPFGRGPFPSCGSGTWSTLAAAALLGVPVVAFPVRLSSCPPATLPPGHLVPLPGGGQWQPGPWPGSWAWAPAQRPLGLF